MREKVLLSFEYSWIYTWIPFVQDHWIYIWILINERKRLFLCIYSTILFVGKIPDMAHYLSDGSLFDFLVYCLLDSFVQHTWVLLYKIIGYTLDSLSVRENTFLSWIPFVQDHWIPFVEDNGIYLDPFCTRSLDIYSISYP